MTIITPGPNNVMLMTSGLNFGFRHTVPHLLGVIIGFSFQVLCVGLGLGVLFVRYPALYLILKYVGALYLLYLAWIIAKSDSVTDPEAHKTPMTFLQAAAFQWVNPKAWIMAVGSVSTYAPIADYPYNIFIISGSMFVLGVGTCSGWAAFGSFLQHFLHKPRVLRAFNIVMAILLVASLYPVFAES